MLAAASPPSADNSGSITYSGTANFGGIAGIISGNVSVDTAKNSGSLTVNNTKAVSAGGIVGSVENGTSSEIKNAENTAAISYNGSARVGGVAGYALNTNFDKAALNVYNPALELLTTVGG